MSALCARPAGAAVRCPAAATPWRLRPEASRLWLGTLLVFAWLLGAVGPASAQSYHFTLRADPDVIPANGISTTSIFVQLQDSGRSAAITVTPIVRFVTSGGSIEPQAVLAGGTARVLLRSSATPGTVVVTAIIGSAREQIPVEFSQDAIRGARFLQVAGQYVAYGAVTNTVTASGRCSFDYGETHIESDVRLDIDFASERLWAEGSPNGITIRHGGRGARLLRGDRLYYDIRRRRGVMRRSDTTQGPPRQEFMDSDFKPIPIPGSQRVVTDSAPAAAEPPTGIEPSPPIGQASLPEVDGKTDDGSLATASEATSDSGVTPAATTVGTTSDDAEAPPPPPTVPAYRSLPTVDPTAALPPQITEPLPPEIDNKRGYWVTARLLRIFPQDKIQFERAAIYFNGKRMFTRQYYFAPLNGGFDPATDMVSFNSSGGVSVRVPLVLDMSAKSTSTAYLVREQGNGFGYGKSGPSMALTQEYYLSPRAEGKLNIDQLGRGNWNLDWRHSLRFSPTASGSIYVNMPEHRDTYLRGTLNKQFAAYEVGVEGLYARPRDSQDDVQGQFYARMRPRLVGAGGWTYTVAANLTGWKRYPELVAVAGGGVSLPGQPRPGTDFVTRYRTVYGQTLSTTLQSPSYRPWQGASVQAAVLGTAFNYSNGRRGVSPGWRVGAQQGFGRIANLQVDYTYDRGNVGVFGGSFTHYVSASLNAVPFKKVGTNGYITRSLTDGSVYSTADIEYYISPKWRIGMFTDYSSFPGSSSLLGYGWTLGRTIGNRELTVNWDRVRHHVYFELGGYRY